MNQKYEIGLQRAVAEMRQRGRPCNVLDIGTGTGLLSMMAVRSGADTVIACDAFEPAAKCAVKIIAANGMSGKIKVIRKRSTELTVPEDLPQRANILVTEVFDTELIGEGAIGTYRHALQHLLEPDCIVVPSAARMYIQPVESSYLWSRNELQFSLPDGHPLVTLPPNMETYQNGLAAPLCDLQLSQLPEDTFAILADPVHVFSFDFCGRCSLPVTQVSLRDCVMKRSGHCQAFFMWWDIDMDMDGEVILSCAPHWEHPDPKDKMQWRDHWMQAVFYPSRALSVERGASYCLRAEHDEYSLAFDILSHNAELQNEISLTEDNSVASLHCSFTRSRLAALNDPSIANAFMPYLKKTISGDSVVLCLSEGSALGFLAARLGAKQVLLIETNFMTKRVMSSIITHNKLQDRMTVYGKLEEIDRTRLDQVDLVVAEPYFHSSLLPWHDLSFWHMRMTLKHDVKVIPRRGRLMALLMQFDDLHKIRAPVGICEGLDLGLYDEMIEGARTRSDAEVEPQPLWEYPGVALSQTVQLLTLDFTQGATDEVLQADSRIPVQHDGKLNGIAIWMEYDIDECNTMSYGITESVKPGCCPKWNMLRQQGVYLPLVSPEVTANTSCVKYTVKYNTTEGDMTFQFSVS